MSQNVSRLLSNAKRAIGMAVPLADACRSNLCDVGRRDRCRCCLESGYETDRGGAIRASPWTKYAAGIATSYLNGVSQVLQKIEREEKRLALVTEDVWSHNPNQIVSILQTAQAALLEPSGSPQSDDVEQYREELPLALFADLRLVLDLKKTSAKPSRNCWLSKRFTVRFRYQILKCAFATRSENLNTQ